MVEPAVPSERRNSKAVRRARTAAATAARKRSAPSGAAEDDVDEDRSRTPGSSGSSASGMRFMRRSTSPAFSIASNMSELSDLRPSATGNRLVSIPQGQKAAMRKDHLAMILALRERWQRRSSVTGRRVLDMSQYIFRGIDYLWQMSRHDTTRELFYFQANVEKKVATSIPGAICNRVYTLGTNVSK